MPGCGAPAIRERAIARNQVADAHVFRVLLLEERVMNARELAELPLDTGYVYENGTPFHEKLGEERAAALLRALRAHGYCIVPEPRTTRRAA
jgi:hypothetical protein